MSKHTPSESVDSSEDKRRRQLVPALHAIIKRSWASYGITAPPLNGINRAWLRAAVDVANEVENVMPKTGMALLAVPPSSLLLKAKVRRATLPNDFTPTEYPDWRLLALDMNPYSGIALGSPDEVDAHRPEVAGHDIRALGVLEYAAAALQSGFQIDTGTFSATWLPKDRQGDKVPYATTDPLGIHYNLASASTNFPQVLFRLAVDIPKP